MTSSKVDDDVTKDSTDIVACIDSASVHGQAIPRSDSAILISLRSKQGLCRLVGCPELHTFTRLATHFVPQKPLQCGITSLTIALNTLGMTCDVASVFRDLQNMPRRGREAPVTLAELAHFATSNYLGRIQARTYRPRTIKGFRRFVRSYLHTRTRSLSSRGVVIANISRHELGYESKHNGHMSPLAAYHSGSDSILLLDVSPEWQSVWIQTTDLFRSINTIDKQSRSRRGCIIVGHKTP